MRKLRDTTTPAPEATKGNRELSAIRHNGRGCSPVYMAGFLIGDAIAQLYQL
jgi:hypothetical protein